MQRFRGTKVVQDPPTLGLSVDDKRRFGVSIAMKRQSKTHKIDKQSPKKLIAREIVL